MSTHIRPSIPRPLRTAGVVATTFTLGAFGFSACSAISKVRTAVHDIRGNKATIDAFNTKLQSGAATTFEATYVTTGSAPTTIVYAVASGEFACSQSSSGGAAAQWTCEKLGTANAAVQNKIFNFYTPAHWITFLRDFSLAAGIAGDKVTSSTMTVNGFNLNCVDFNAGGVPGTSTICSTDQGILGYVKVASDSTSFEIQSFSTSPPASLFELPPGATVTTTPTGNS